MPHNAHKDNVDIEKKGQIIKTLTRAKTNIKIDFDGELQTLKI